MSAPSITATLQYSVPPENGARAEVYTYIPVANGERKKNFGNEDREVVIENLRGKEGSVTLDTAGFQFFHQPSKHTSFASDDEIVREYYPESIEVIKKLTGGSRVVLFDHTVRRRLPGHTDTDPLRRQPAAQVHVDQTTKASIARVHRHLPAPDVPKLLEGRFQIINLWRPINHPAIDWPLTLCDYRSVGPADTFPVARIDPEREGETMAVKYNPNHKWKYLHGMTPDEIVLIKCSDSISDGSVAAFTPHTAFNDPTTPEGTPFRESIELRALVFYD